MKILLIDECYPINTRNSKILASMTKSYPESEVHVITWDREGKYCSKKESYCEWQWHLYTRSAAYGNKVQKLFGLFGFRSFCCKTIKKLHPDVVIASHWNNLLMLPRLEYESQMLIYENLDAPTGPALFRKILKCIEHHYMKSALTVHASRFYLDLYPAKFNQLVLENKPVIEVNTKIYSPRTPLRIAYLGNIRYLDILKKLADSVRGDDRFLLSFHGGGPDYFQLKEYVADAPNIRLTGPYHYSDISDLYNESDIIWAAYPNNDFNVRYAISNKFHESLAYHIPAIYANNTCLGEYVESLGLGFQVDPYSISSIRRLLDMIDADRNSLMRVHQALKKQYQKETLWNVDFSRLKSKVDAFLGH